MKHLLYGLVVALTATGALGAVSGTYMKFDIGANYTGEIRQEFSNLPISRDLDMNIGIRGSVAEGFVLNKFLALEVEAGAAWNELDESVDWFMQVPILANLLFRYECKGGWTTFAGVGAGGAVAIVNSTVIADDSDITLVPAWQGTAGISYNFSANASFGVVYKYMGIGNPKFELEVLGMTQKFKFKDIHNHYGGLQLTYSF